MHDPIERRDDANQLGPFEASGLAFAMAMANLYDVQYDGNQQAHEGGGRPIHRLKLPLPLTLPLPLPLTLSLAVGLYVVPWLLREACKDLNLTNLGHSGWVQYYLYQTLYCCDVEKPESEEQIKRVSRLNNDLHRTVCYVVASNKPYKSAITSNTLLRNPMIKGNDCILVPLSNL